MRLGQTLGRRAVRGVLVSALVAASIPAGGLSAGAGGVCWNPKAKEKRFVRKINRARSRNDARLLRLDPQISRVARKHTREMVNHRLLFHTSDATLNRRVTNWEILGENVGVKGSVRLLHRTFMKSPVHRYNILRRGFRYVGVGTKRAYGVLWVTVVFEGQTNPGTRLSMPKC